MNRLRFFILLCCLLTVSVVSVAQTVSGNVISREDGEPVIGAYVGMFAGDSISSMGQTGLKGEFSFSLKKPGRHTVTVSALGYKDAELSFMPDTLSAPLLIYMDVDKSGVELGEVVVSADKSEMVKRTANGQVFFLSKEAKGKSNPFVALQEIPVIISDPNTSSVTTLDGKAPLVLINGNRVNSGISPVNPSAIESVEVIDVVPARYLQMGYTSIINIKLKPVAAPYVWVEAASRYNIPASGMGVGYFEVGNQTYSLYGRASYNFTHDEDENVATSRVNTGYTQNYDSRNRTNSHSWLGELMFKWSPTENDYFAAHAYVNYDHSRLTENGSGEYCETVAVPYLFASDELNKGRVVTSSIYYKHTFGVNNDLEFRAAYNHNGNDFDSERKDEFGTTPRTALSVFSNLRNSGNLDIDYSKSFASGLSMSLGSHTTGRFDRIDQVSTGYPVFRHRQLNEYLFGSLSGKAGKVFYLVSAGVESIWLKAGDTDNNYVRPRGALSGTWSINSHNSLQLGYTLSNEAPEVAMLNPYDTSTDSMMIVSGNPYLTPQTTHNVKLNYTFNLGRFYLSPTVSYSEVSDLIEAGGYTDAGIFHSTYLNDGHYSNVYYNLMASYRFKWGRLGAYGGWMDNYYMDQSSRRACFVGFNFNVKVNDYVSFYGYLYHTNRDVARNSTIKYRNFPSMAQVQVNYNFTPDFYIAFGLDYNSRTRMIVNEGTYYSMTDRHFVDKELMPWVLVRYTFRKNTNRKMKLNNNLFNSQEKGINIKK